MKKSTRKTKWVGWFSNSTDRRDDEWRSVRASSLAEARKLLEGTQRGDEYLEHVYTVVEFRDIYGNLPC